MSAVDGRGLMRQGDVLLVPVSGVPAETNRVAVGERVTLAEGEATGHAHVVGGLDVSLYEDAAGTLFLLVGGDVADLVHEEHAALPLVPGAYEVRRQREYVPQDLRADAFRWVTD